jgi:pimeloyl-ACP methyl ester carboxylesterase
MTQLSPRQILHSTKKVIKDDDSVIEMHTTRRRLIQNELIGADQEKYIPCLFIQKRTKDVSKATACTDSDQTKGTKVILYFHGNAEDVSHSYEFFVRLSVAFKCSVLAVEYPGYGVYKTEEPDADTIRLDSELVLQFLVRNLRYDVKDIILMGRSMGSGPCCALAAENPGVQALVLMSPYTSLKHAVKTLLGTLASLLVRERFENLESIKKVRCPTLIIHGQADTLLHESHAI